MACYRTNTGTECNTFIINVVLIFTINHIRSDLHTRISCRTRECAHSHCNQNWYKSYISTWVYPVLSIRCKLINVKASFQSDPDSQTDPHQARNSASGCNAATSHGRHIGSAIGTASILYSNVKISC